MEPGKMEVELPCKKCKGQCCTFPVFSREELTAVQVLVGVPREAILRPIEHAHSYDPAVRPGSVGFVVHKKDGFCPYLSKTSDCTIYNLRPKVCRDYGQVPDLPCQYLYPNEARQKAEESMRLAKERPAYLR